jgi:exopolysaccharide production protein ExoQ
MTPEELFNAWPSFVAVTIVTLVALLSLAAMVYIASRLRLEWMSLFFAGLILSMVVTVVLQKRDLGIELPMDMDTELASDRASQAITLICLIVAFERVIRFVLQREYRRARGGWLLAALLFYIIVVNVVSSLLGTHGGVSVHLFYAPLFALAVFAYAQENVQRCVVVTRNALLAFMLVSLATLVVRREMVAEPNYTQSFLPGISDRFYGFASHANTLAPLCFVLMSCLILHPFSRRWLTALAWAAASICVLLSQSKTSIGLAMLLVGVLVLRSRFLRAREQDGHRMGTRSLGLLTALSLAATVVVTLSLLGMVSGPNFSAILPEIADRQQMASFTGRTTIWRETLKVAYANPLFGYGPTLWDADFQHKTGMIFSHAHSQYVQTLGAAGILGSVALVCYLVVLLGTAWRVRVGTKGVSVALALFVIVRGATEVPLSVTSAMQGEFLVQMYLLALCVGFLPTTQRGMPFHISRAGKELRA